MLVGCLILAGWIPEARRVLSERVAFGILPAALFALLPSCSLSGSVYNRFSQVTSPSRGFEV